MEDNLLFVVNLYPWFNLLVNKTNLALPVIMEIVLA